MDKEVTINVYEPMKHPQKKEECQSIDKIKDANQSEQSIEDIITSTKTLELKEEQASTEETVGIDASTSNCQ